MTMAISEDTGNNNNPSKKDIERPAHLGNLINNSGSQAGLGGPNMDMMDHQSCGTYSGRTPPSGASSAASKWAQMHTGSWDGTHNSAMEPTYAPLVKVVINMNIREIKIKLRQK